MNFYTLETMQPVFELLERCRGIPQMEKHHPEGDVLNHSLQVLQWAFRESEVYGNAPDIDLILAAMLHDVGKYENSLGHEKIAVKWLENHVSIKTLWLIEHHMRIGILFKGNMRRLGKVNYLINHPWLPELVLLTRWDKMGRDPNKRLYLYNEKSVIVERLNKCVEMRFEKEENSKNAE